jgi:thiamine pyrophosphokinase
MRAVVLANGIVEQPMRIRKRLEPADTVIAADGGALLQRPLGLTLDTVIGDMDSLTARQQGDLRNRGVEMIVHPRDKDQTDLELAVDLAVQRGADRVDIVGATGGRWDMTLSNVMLLARDDWSSAALRILAEDAVLFVLRGPESATLSGRPGDGMSLIPLSPLASGVTLSGFKYPLERDDLVLGSTWGLSNEFQTESPRIHVEAGRLLIIHSD